MYIDWNASLLIGDGWVWYRLYIYNIISMNSEIGAGKVFGESFASLLEESRFEKQNSAV